MAFMVEVRAHGLPSQFTPIRPSHARLKQG